MFVQTALPVAAGSNPAAPEGFAHRGGGPAGSGSSAHRGDPPHQVIHSAAWRVRTIRLGGDHE